MKVLAVMFMALLAAVSSKPSDREIILPVPEGVDRSDPRIIEGIISSILEDLSEQIREQGLDPFNFEGTGLALGLPVPVLFNIDVDINNIRVTGLSDIVINSMNFSILNTRLDLDVSIPRLEVTLDSFTFDISILGHRLNGEIRNIRLGVVEAGLVGNVRVAVLPSIAVREINLDAKLDRITFDGSVNILGNDMTAAVKTFCTVYIPNVLAELRNEINELVEIIAWQLF